MNLFDVWKVLKDLRISCKDLNNCLRVFSQAAVSMIIDTTVMLQTKTYSFEYEYECGAYGRTAACDYILLCFSTCKLDSLTTRRCLSFEDVGCKEVIYGYSFQKMEYLKTCRMFWYLASIFINWTRLVVKKKRRTIYIHKIIINLR